MKQLLFSMMITLTMVLGSANAEDKQGFQNTFAVVWNMVTSDHALVNDTLADQASATLVLWKQGIIENVYMNTDAKPTAEEKSTTITFFIKADTRTDAALVLNELPFVKRKLLSINCFQWASFG